MACARLPFALTSEQDCTRAPAIARDIPQLHCQIRALPTLTIGLKLQDSAGEGGDDKKGGGWIKVRGVHIWREMRGKAIGNEVKAETPKKRGGEREKRKERYTDCYYRDG